MYIYLSFQSVEFTSKTTSWISEQVCNVEEDNESGVDVGVKLADFSLNDASLDKLNFEDDELIGGKVLFILFLLS